MKILFFLSVIFTFTGSLHAQQQYYRIELLKEGQAILQTTPVSSSDVSWWMNLKGKDCVVRDAFANFDLWNSRVNLQLHVDLADFSRFCGSYAVGDSVHVYVEVTNPEHVLYGYAGENTYAIRQKEYSEDFLGANGINLRPRPRIRVEDVEACGRNGDLVTAVVTHAPEGYFVDWVDPRLEPSRSDQARIVGFPGDTVISLSAILRDKDGKGLDTAYYKLKLKPLPEVEVTPEYDIRSEGETYTLLGTFHEDLDYQWVYSRVSLSRSARKTVSFPEVMGKTDVRYELFVTDRTTGCRNSDTAWVYLRPKAPVIDIDTNTTRNDIRISWNADTNYTYSLMSIKWDGYGILEDYHLRHTFTGETDRFALSQKELDTLEFFYMTANRYIPALNRTISSVSSDTVGYMKQAIKAYAGTGKTNTNYIAYPFDMSGKGITTLEDIGRALGRNADGVYYVLSVGNFIFEQQEWNIDPYLSVIDSWMGENKNLVPGEVYLVTVDTASPPIDLLMYGKLLPPFSYDLKTAVPGKTGSNMIIQPLSLIQKNRRQLIGEIIPHALTVGIFDYENQRWNIATHMIALDRWLPKITSENPPVIVRPWMPLFVTVQEAVNWKP